MKTSPTAPPSCRSRSPQGGPPQRPWSREQIRRARRTPLAPLLQKRGLELIPRPADNFELAAYPGLLLKAGYWRWPQRQLAGNAIDFFTAVLGLSFHQAMQQICPPNSDAPPS